MKLNPVCEKKTMKERMRGKRKPPEEKGKEEYPEARGWSGNDFWPDGESLRWIVLQDADLLGTLQFLLLDLGLDPVSNGRRVGIRGFGLFRGGAGGGTGSGRAPLAHEGNTQWGSRRNGRKERCDARAERKEEDDDGDGVG
jgi:hypothetical protein